MYKSERERNNAVIVRTHYYVVSAQHVDTMRKGTHQARWLSNNYTKTDNDWILNKICRHEKNEETMDNQIDIFRYRNNVIRINVKQTIHNF